MIALALSVLFEMLAHHQTTSLGSWSPKVHPPPPDPIRRMFGADTGSNISSIASMFLKQVAGFEMLPSNQSHHHQVSTILLR